MQLKMLGNLLMPIPLRALGILASFLIDRAVTTNTVFDCDQIV